MKQALLVGCGSKFGLGITNTLINLGWTVNLITSNPCSNANCLIVDWNNIDHGKLAAYLKNLPELDLVFFNQNSRSIFPDSFKPGKFDALELYKQDLNWKKTHYNNCILPFHIVHTLEKQITDRTRIGWMLSQLVYYQAPNPGFADYIGNKFQNFVVMNNFSKHSPAHCFGITPKKMEDIVIEDFVKLITSIEQTGKVFYPTGELDTNYNRFTAPYNINE